MDFIVVKKATKADKRLHVLVFYPFEPAEFVMVAGMQDKAGM